MADIKRHHYPLPHFSMKTGAIGSLQTLSVRPVVAGDSYSMDAKFVFRFSPMRRNLYMDAQVDLAVFFVPHRHIYAANSAGSRWPDFMLAGTDEGITLGTDQLAATAVLSCVGYNQFGTATSPRWLTRGYMQIYRNYYAEPSDTTAQALADNYFTTLTAGDAKLAYGLPCCHIKRLINTPLPSTLTSADYSLPLSGGEVNLYELAALKGRLKSETRRDWFALRYRDLMNNVYGSKGVNIDADQRPMLVMRKTQWLSGYDVDGTDAATLGTYSGKAAGLASISFPKKFFPEHGTLWVMALVRFPQVVVNEFNYLASKAEPTYAQIAGDPDIVRRTAPVAVNTNEIIAGGSSVSLGNIPHSQWYREQPHLVHNDYLVSSGHPFLNLNTASTRTQVVYIAHDLYDDVFMTTQLKHWNCQGRIDLDCNSFVPPPEESIFAGTE